MYIVTYVSNKGNLIFLKIMQAMDISKGINSHKFVIFEGSYRINLAKAGLRSAAFEAAKKAKSRKKNQRKDIYKELNHLRTTHDIDPKTRISCKL